MNNKHFNLRTIILITLIAIFSGVIFWGAGFLYTGLTLALTPIGLAPMANDLLMGLWCMAGPLAGMIIRIPGSALLGEFLASSIEVFLGGQFGAIAFVNGLVQGAGSEVGFALTGYKKYNWVGLTLSVLTTTIVTFGWDFFKSGYSNFSLGLLIILFVTRFISMFIFSGVLIQLVSKLLAKSNPEEA